MALNTYATGTVSVTAGGTTVTGSGTIWSGNKAVAGDEFVIAGVRALIVDIVDVTHLTITPWPGADQSGASYAIYQTSSQRFDDVNLAINTGKVADVWTSDGFYVFVPSAATEPDPSLGDDGQFGFQAVTGKMWVKEAGLWSFLGIYKGFSPKGTWSVGTAYVPGDVVSLDGASYVAIADTTANTPPNATYWQVLSEKGGKGDKGDPGDAATIAVAGVTTLPAGSSATVTNSGDQHAASLNFGIPRGDQGVQGLKGDQGQGIQPNATGTAAEKASHDAETKGFVFLETDVSPFELWVKASATSGDWAGPTYVTGNVPVGDLGFVTDTIEQSFDLGVLA